MRRRRAARAIALVILALAPMALAIEEVRTLIAANGLTAAQLELLLSSAYVSAACTVWILSTGIALAIAVLIEILVRRTSGWRLVAEAVAVVGISGAAATYGILTMSLGIARLVIDPVGTSSWIPGLLLGLSVGAFVAIGALGIGWLTTRTLGQSRIGSAASANAGATSAT